MAEPHHFPFKIFLFLFFFSVAVSASLTLPPSLSANLHTDSLSLSSASSDYGHIVHTTPAGVFFPSAPADIAALIQFLYSSPVQTDVAARGEGHSVRGQATAANGVVVNMTALGGFRRGAGVVVEAEAAGGPYADVGGEQMWIDVLHGALEKGMAPVSWTDYLRLSVGGTLSNAGIGGQTFRFGPQISNVYELDVITGKGELLTCSPTSNPELFYGVLGGLGQFGIITRARIALAPAPTRVKWVRMLYSNFSSFSRDQELLISNNGADKPNALHYIEGSLLLHLITPDNSSFYPLADQPRIAAFVSDHGLIYVLEVVKHYDEKTAATVDRDLETLLGGLSYEPGFKFVRDASYEEFLDRVHSDELALRALGLWEVPHPWLNLFIPKSRIADFDSGVFQGIVRQRNLTSGIILVYPMFRNKWDDRMSAVIPEEEVFYTAGFLFASGLNDWETVDGHNKDILKYCKEAGIEVKQYLPHYETQPEWGTHFGQKWPTFRRRKAMFDPKKLLSPGQKIFN